MVVSEACKVGVGDTLICYAHIVAMMDLICETINILRRSSSSASSFAKLGCAFMVSGQKMQICRFGKLKIMGGCVVAELLYLVSPNVYTTQGDTQIRRTSKSR